MENNTYAQIGIVLIIAIAIKYAILIIEFAGELRLIRVCASVPDDIFCIHFGRLAAGVC